MKKKEDETLYLGQDFKKRFFPQDAKQVDINFKETPLFKAQTKAEEKQTQLNLLDRIEEAIEKRSKMDKATRDSIDRIQ